MGTSVLPYRYRINGLIDTSKTAIDNLELIGNSCATWLTYDVQDGKWAVVINRAGTSVHSFNDDNIIGAIKLNGTGLTDQYNGVEVRFPHRDLNDQDDWVRIEIPAEDRLPNEPDNILTMDLPMMNEPVQAQVVGLIELKQARLDKIITFQSDYSKINLQAGNIIDVSSDVYGWDAKLFRIIRMEETDVDGAIVIEITALEYDDNVYDLTDLYRYTRTNEDGILTQGALGTPTDPSVTKFEEDANPRVEITSTTPDNTDPLNQAGIIEGMEFWISTDGTNYTLLGTKRPDSALTYEANTDVTYSYNNIGTSFYVKTRCINSTTTGEFSGPTSVIFAPVQVPDAIKDGSTSLLNSSGIGIPAALGIATLVGKVASAVGSNASAKLSDAVFTEAGFPGVSSVPIFATFQTTLSPSAVDTAFNTYIGSTPIGFNSSGYAAVGNGAVLSFSLGATVQQLMLITQCPQVQCSYEYYDNDTASVETRTGLYAYMPCLYEIYRGGTKIQQSTADWQTQSIIILIENATPASYEIRVKPLQTYDLNQTTNNEIWFYDQSTFAQASGGGITATAFGFSVLS